jgi:hypothetical protein
MRTRMTSDDEYVFFGTALVLAPVCVLSAYHARYLDPRYFFVVMPFVWLLAARGLTTLCQSGLRGATVAALCIGYFTVGTAIHLIPLLRNQRGNYAAVVSTAASLTAQRESTIGCDQDISNRMLLAYYAESLPTGRELVYLPMDTWNRGVPDWFMTHSSAATAMSTNAPPTITVGDGAAYRLVRSFPYGGISGWSWSLYRRLPER